MLFNSAIFLFLFLPITLLVYFTLGAARPRAAALWLVVASGIFYANWNPPFLIILAVSVAVNYCFSLLIRHFSERPGLQSATLAIAVVINLLGLFYFKYLFPLLGWLASFGIRLPHSNDSIILPLGISFFTFTQLGYLIDMRAGTIKERGFVNYALFATFFPHLIAGPILHHREIMPQFARPETYRMNADDLSAGTTWRPWPMPCSAVHKEWPCLWHGWAHSPIHFRSISIFPVTPTWPSGSPVCLASNFRLISIHPTRPRRSSISGSVGT
jgi:alginate O-acetyltransferase complex protein AlgI